MPLPTVSVCGLAVSKLVAGGGPFSGELFGATAAQREELLDHYTAAQIRADLEDCETAGLTALFARANTHIARLLREHWRAGGRLQWVAVTSAEVACLAAQAQRAVDAGAVAICLDGDWAQTCWERDRQHEVAVGLDAIRSTGVPAGLAGAHPAHHLAGATAWAPDFHLVSCFRTPPEPGGGLEHLELSDLPIALAAMRRIAAPCFAYHVLAGGLLDPRPQLTKVIDGIKPNDGIIVGFHTGEDTDQIGVTARLVAELLAGEERIDAGG